jgi:hypothetical protein
MNITQVGFDLAKNAIAAVALANKTARTRVVATTRPTLGTDVSSWDLCSQIGLFLMRRSSRLLKIAAYEAQ